MAVNRANARVRAGRGGTGTAVSTGARLQVAELRRDALQTVYGTAAGGELAENLLQIVAPADHAVSDRWDALARWVATGLAVGFLLGILLAARRESRLRDRTADSTA